MNTNKSSITHWIERLSALHRSLMRKFAATETLQFVHVEIIQYLSICNRYSDTTQALSEYLGQTKGSISQSLGFLEKEGYLKRHQDKKDKRVFHLTLTSKGIAVSDRLNQALNLQGIEKLDEALNSVLATLQKKNGLQSFGLCKTCQYNINQGKGTFQCGLTKEQLTLEDIEKICREHKIA